MSSSELDQAHNIINGNGPTTASNHSAGAVAAAQGPKVVQTAFIHKLYNMLEDQGIQHLISWSDSNESFVMSPSNEFSKVLAQYFKHTNISSFVRQLNMYGFHKVSDVFHTGSPDSALWEFKHGNGNFKKGDLTGLREIKRRASRHALIHRESFTGGKPGVSHPALPAEILPDSDTRLANLEYAVQDMHNRLTRAEENYATMSSRCQALTEQLVQCHEWRRDLTQALQDLIPNEHRLHGEIAGMQKQIVQQLEQAKSLELPHESLLTGRQPFFANMSLDPPLSPHSFNFDERRRSSIQIHDSSRLNSSRPPVPPIPPQFASSPKRFGSIGTVQESPGFSRPPLPTHQPIHVHPLSAVAQAAGPNLARRHTSADIREHGWPVPSHPNVGVNGSPYVAGQWPSESPSHHAQQVAHVGLPLREHTLRDHLASYELNPSRRESTSTLRQSPPLPEVAAPPPPVSSQGADQVPWSSGFAASKFPRPNFEMHSAPATRRGSMASNVHNLLNPAETAERDGEDDEGPVGERSFESIGGGKRKRY